jgi:hypothetical protein
VFLYVGRTNPPMVVLVTWSALELEDRATSDMPLGALLAMDSIWVELGPTDVVTAKLAEASSARCWQQVGLDGYAAMTIAERATLRRSSRT